MSDNLKFAAALFAFALGAPLLVVLFMKYMVFLIKTFML